ncbi:MAG: arginine--tRNA ligase, partial [Clostridia bacterium]|nr:arginine--tRNA ligase [Clostridia bacterium]
VLSKAGNRGNFTGGELNDAEILLAKTLATFPDRVKSALDGYEPSEVTRFILDLCAAYNRFYHDCPIVTAEDEREKNNRVALTAAVNTVLGRALSLICLKTPEKI